MDLLPSGSNTLQSGQLIGIATPYFNFYLKGPLKAETLRNITAQDEALYEVSCEDEVKIHVHNVGESHEKYFHQKAVPQFFEQTAYQVLIHEKGGAKVVFDHDSILIRKQVAPIEEGEPIQMGVINFGNEIGLTQFRILVDDKFYLKMTLEIYPTKLSYKSDYLQLREDVAQEIYNLTFDFMRKTYLGASLKASEQPSLTEFFSIFKEQFQVMHQAVTLIERQPHHEMVALEEIKTYKHGEYIGPKGIRYLNKHPQQVTRQGNQFIPHKVLQVHKQLTTNVYENQMVKYMLGQIHKRLQMVKVQYNSLQREKDQAVIDFLNGQMHLLETKLNGSFFKGVSKLDRILQFSIVLQMSPVYRQFYKIYLILQKGLSITTDIFNISNKNMAELYEYWCFIKLGSLLKEKHNLISTDFIKSNQQGLFVNLKKGKQSEMHFKHGITGEVFTLAYNQRLKQGPTVVQKPDNILTLKKEMADVNYRYVLDAKYKMDYKTTEAGTLEIPREEDINTMHRYRDAIVHENKADATYERDVFGGIILFPGTASEAYKSSRFYQSIEKVNIGALPFLPSQTHLVVQFLDEIIDRIGHEEYENIPKLNGMVDYLKDLEFTTEDVLIGTLRSVGQLNTVLKEKLYYVPCKNIKNSLNRNFKYVVLYEQQKIGTLPQGGIRYIGAVETVTIKKRNELEDLFPITQNNPEEEYLVYSVKKWSLLKQTILPNGYGVRKVGYTNMTLLKYAKTLPELYIKEPIEFKLILQLRRLVKDLETHLLNEDKIVITHGQVNIVVDEYRNIIVQMGEEEELFTLKDLECRPKVICKAILDIKNKGLSHN
ncbi:MAG: DUF2357 domain-containing protein [Clostridium sp.]|nr:DUF2357 domain-containing protein [Clostridium sp.]